MILAILGSNDRAALTVVRQLALEPTITKLIVVRSSNQKSLSCVSKYTSKSIYHNFNQNDPDKLIRHLKEEDVDILLPINDTTSLFVVNHFDCLSAHFTLASPQPDSYFQAIDKWGIRQLCDGERLKFPESIVLSSDVNLKDLSIVDEYSYFKTRFSVIYNNKNYAKYNVRKLSDTYKKYNYITDHIGVTDIICQKPLVGSGIGLNVLAKDGHIISISKNERLHQPKDGGGSSYRKTSQNLSDGLYDIASHISEKLNWSGVMMIELLKAEDGYYLIEINPRFWGSLALTEFSGGNYVRNFYRQSTGLELLETKCLDVKVRHLINDIKWMKNNFNLSNLANLITSPIKVIKGEEKYDVERISDIYPAFYQLFLLQKKLNSLLSVKVIKLKSKVLKRIGKPKVWDEICESKNYIFMCKGNINRSSFAEYYIKKLGYKQFVSAGHLCPTKDNRLPSYQLLKVNNFDDSLVFHRSKNILNNFGNSNEFILIALDKEIYFTLKSMGFINIILFSENDVEDPHGKSDSSFINVVQQIQEVINEKCAKNAN